MSLYAVNAIPVTKWVDIWTSFLRFQTLVIWQTSFGL